MQLKTCSILILAILLAVLLPDTSFGQNPQTIDSLLRRAKAEPSEKQKAMLYSLIAEEYYFNKPDSAILYCYIGMHYSTKNHDVEDLAYFHNFLGVLYKNIAVYDSAIVHFNKAIDLNRADRFESGVAACQNNLGKTLFLVGDYAEALNNFNSSLAIFEKQKDTLNIGEVHSNIAALLIKINEFDAAEEHLLLSRQQYRLAKAQLQEAWILYDMGNLKLTTGFYDDALRLFVESSLVWKQFDRIKEYQNCMLRMGEILVIKERFAEAESLFDKAREQFSSINNTQGVAESYMLLGRAQYLRGKNNEAIANLEKALELSAWLASKQLKLEVYRTLYQCHKSNKTTEKALLYLEQYQALNDTIFSENRNQLLAEYQTRLNLSNKESIIKTLEDSTQRQQLINQNISLQNQQKQNSIYALVFLTIIIALFLIFIFRRNKRTAKLNRDLNTALKEREVLIREVHHRVKNNLQIISSLLNLQSEKASDEQTTSILRISQSRIEAMSMMHENLYKSANLSEISFPEYVDNLCMYLKTSFSLEEKGIEIHCDIASVQLDIDMLVPCGLIINELVTNSIKHAFENQDEKIIAISCHPMNGLLKMEISDNGKGLPDGFEVSKSSSLGMRLATGLARQLRSQLHTSNRNGFYAWFEFKNEKK